MLLNDTRIAANAQPYLTVAMNNRRNGGTTETNPAKAECVAPENVSDAIERSRFLRTSIHVPGKKFTLQISNVEVPNQAADSTDWVDLATTTTGYIDTDVVAKYFRIKAAQGDTLPADTPMYVLSIFSKY